jgi:hypothetical protein
MSIFGFKIDKLSEKKKSVEYVMNQRSMKKKKNGIELNYLSKFVNNKVNKYKESEDNTDIFTPNNQNYEEEKDNKHFKSSGRLMPQSLRIPIIKRYKNFDRTLTEKFSKRFTENLEKEFIKDRLINKEIDIITKAEQKSKVFITIEFTFLDDLKGFIDDLVDTGYVNNTTKPQSYLTTNVFVTEKNNTIYRQTATSFDENYHFNSARVTQQSYNPRPKLCDFKETKVTNLSKCLNTELNRISHNFGKVGTLKRFQSNPVRDKLFEEKQYLAFRNNKMTEVRPFHRRAKLAPLYIKEDPKERLARTLFNMKRNILRYVKDNTM